MADSDKFPTEFVPVSRPLIKELGYEAAYVFGVIWNYCQMEKGFCDAAHQTIADRADMSRRSVIKYIDKLIKAGYIEDLTPDAKNTPHQLCTKKGVQILHTREQERYAETAQQTTHQNGSAMQELPTRYAEIAQPGMQILHPNRQSKENISKDSGNPPVVQKPEKKQDGPKWQLVKEFTALTGIHIPENDKITRGFWFNKIGVILKEAGDDIDKGKKLMREAVDRLGIENVYDPNSLLKTIRKITAEKNHKPKVSFR